jgi:serine/threonine protein phosphatase 1
MPVKSLFNFMSRAEPAPPAVPAGRRIYAIGDIHGRLDLLDELLERIGRTTRPARPRAPS